MELSTKLFRKRSYRLGVVCFLMCFLFFNALVSVVNAGPEGAQVVNGQVAIQQSGSNTAITASDKAIINYSSFDIAQPETVRFFQPGSNASVLNRILSANPTNINGTLLANGRVFFVNPAGVYIGAGARINVNQLVASGLNISNADFINGQYNFAGGIGAVINSGDISAQQVYLIGKQVINSGNISCPAGYVVMAAGDRVFLGEPGSDIVLDVEGTSLSDSANAAAPEVGVLNEGTIDAPGGIIALAAAGDIYSQAISNVGSLSTSVNTGDAGQIKLAAAGGEVVNTGTIEASGSEGGQVAMEGARVGQFGTIHADGITGDGGNVKLTASDVVALSPGSLTTANAGTNGDGGDVTVFSPDSALLWADALIEAKGGSESGDGGFVEISGIEYVMVNGSVDRRAPHGEAGLLYIDPTDLTINDAEVDDTLWTGHAWADDTGIATSQIDIDTLESHIALGDTSIDTTTGGGGGSGNITVNAGRDIVDGGSGYSLSLTGTDITFTSGVNFSSTGNLDVLASGAVEIDSGINLAGGNFTSTGTTFDNTGGVITTAGGAVDIQNTGNVTIGAAINAGAGDVYIDGGAGVATSIIDGGGIITSSGTITLEASGDIGTSGTVINTAATGTIDASSTAAGDIYIDNTGNVTLGTIATTASDIVINDTGDVLINTITAGGGGIVNITATGSINESVNDGTDNITTTGAVSLAGATGIGDTSTLDLGSVTNLTLDTDQSFDVSTDGILTDLTVTVDPADESDTYLLVDNDGGLKNLTYTVTDGGTDLSLTDVSVAAGNLNFDLTTDTGNIDVGTVGAGAGTVSLTATAGAINDIAGTVTAQNLEIAGAMAVGASGTPLTIDADNVAATATGGIYLSDSDDLTVSTVGGTTGVTTTANNGVIDIVTNNAALTVNQVVTADGSGSVDLDAGTGGLATTAAISSTSGAITMAADTIDLAASVGSSGSLTLQPTTVAQSIGIGGGTGTFNLTDAEISNLTDGFNSISIGRSSDGQHAVTVDEITFNDPVTIQSPSGGSIAVNGQITGSGDASVSLVGSGATTTLSADIVTAGQDITISDKVVLDEAHTITLNTGADNDGNISITGTTSGTGGGGAENLTLISGTGTTTLDDAVGAGGEIGTLILQADNANATGAVTFDGGVTADTITTYGQAYSVAFNAGGTITTDTSFLNIGTVTLGNEDTDSITFTGGLATTGNASNPSLVNIGGTVITTDTQMDLGAITLTSNSELDTGTAATSIMNVGAVTGGSFDLILDSGANAAADITVTSVDNVGTLTIRDSGGTTFSGTVNVATVTLTDTAGTVAFNGGLTAGTLNTALQGYNVAINAGGAITTDTDFVNTGGVTLGNDATDSITFAGGLDTTVGPSGTNVAGTVATTAQDIDLGATILTDDSALSTGAGAGNITFQNTLNGTTDFAENLALTAGTGNIDFDAAVGGVHDLGDVTISNAADVTIDAAFTAKSITQTAGTGTTLFDGPVQTLGTLATDGLDLNGNAFTFNYTVNTGTAGAVSITNSGLLTIAAAGEMTLGGAFLQDGAGAVSTSADITTTGDTIEFDGDLTLGNDTDITLSTGAGAGDISVSTGGTINGDATPNEESLTLNAGTGSVALGDVFGAAGAANATGLTALTVTNSGAATFDKVGITGALTQTNTATGTTTFNDTVSVGSATLRGTDFAVNNSIVASGPVVVSNSGTLAIAAAGDMSLGGAFTQNGAGAVSTAGNITTTGDNISFLRAVTLTGPVAFNTGAGAGNITFQNTLNGTTDLTENLTLTAGTGNIDFDAAVGGVHDLGNVTINSAANVTIDSSFNANNISITATNTAAHNVTAAVDLTLNSTTTVADGSTLSAGNNLNVGPSLTGEGDLTLVATGGEITGDTINMSVDNQTLSLTQNDTIDMANFSVTNGEDTDLILDSTGGSASVTGSTADNWKSITATAEQDVVLSGDGDITTGNLVSSNASNGVQISTDAGSGGSLVAQGAINSGGFVTVDVDGDAGFADAVTAGGDINLKSGSLNAQGTIDSGGSVTADVVGAAGFADAVTAGGDINLAAGSLNAQGTIDSGGSVTADVVGAASFADAVTAGGDINLAAGSLDAQGTIDSGGLVTVDVVDAAVFADAVTAAGDIDLKAGSLDAQGAIDSGGLVTVDVVGAAGFADAVTAVGDIDLKAGSLDAQGTIDSGGLVTVDVVDAAVFADAVTADGDIDLKAGGLDAQGTIDSGGLVTVDVVGAAVFADAVTAVGNINLAADSLDAQGVIDSGGLVTVDVVGAAGFADAITAVGDIDLKAGSLDAQGTIDSGGLVTVDVVGAASFADTVTAVGNIELNAGDDLGINGNLTTTGGGVSLISEMGKIYTTGGSNDTLNVAITGYSDGAAGTGVDLPYGDGKAAISLRSSEDLILGSSAILTANGTYNTIANDDRISVNFDNSTSSGGGDPIDVAIYLQSNRVVSGNLSGLVAVESKVTMPENSTMVVDAGEKVTFGGVFNESVFEQTQRLEVVSRNSDNLNEVISNDRLPFADNPEAIRNWFNETSGSFTGAYVLRGVRTLLAEVLALSNPVALVPPRPLELKFRGEVVGPDTEALENLLSDLGIGLQPNMTEAYAGSLSTDLRLYKAAEKLQELMPILEDVTGIHIAGLRKTVAEFFPTLDVLSEEQMDSFDQVLENHKGDGTNYDLARQCISALKEYINILGTDIGWPVETSVEFVMGRYVPRLTENDEIRIAVIQMHLQEGL